jgi:hypothetical protein
MGLFSRKVEVTLIDDRSGDVMGVTKLEPDVLPASFFAATTLHLGGDEWSVVSADPMTREEYRSRRRLLLRLRPIERIDPKHLLYSLPTICDRLPAAEGPIADGREVVLREDDWRQFELVSEVFRAEVEQEVAAIRAIHERERVGIGFRNLHVRSMLPHPIEGGRVLLEDVQALVVDRPRRTLRFDGTGKQVSDGFGFPFEEGRVLYGVLSNSGVLVLGFHPAPPRELASLRAFAARTGLLAVDWCRGATAHPNDEAFDSLVRGVG